MKNKKHYNTFKSILLILFTFTAFSCHNTFNKKQPLVKVAFLADVHLQNIYGTFSDSDYKGVLNPKTGKFTLARTMQSQLQSTRLFNENYFAFLATLDDIVEKGVKYVVLPGDFSDDGQMVNIKGLKNILNTYENEHQIKFILTTGNHDPVRSFLYDAGKKDFLGNNGKKQPIYSKKGMFTLKDSSFLKPVITKDIAKLGYKEILSELSSFGFTPKKEDVYWETPFTTYSYETYGYKEALQQADLSKRNYKIPPFNNLVPDVSYLVEPTDNLWFLAIDANVYIPKTEAENNPNNALNYSSSSIGYNNVITHKKHLFKWIKSVTSRAKQLGKTLIVFSHYPVVDFNDDATENIQELLGDKKMQLHRVPKEEVAKLFVASGVTVHFGGHMHINDTGVRNGLVNVQIPSLGAYIPAYKLVTITKKQFNVQTVVVDSVPRFKELFPLYQKEYNYLKKTNAKELWNTSILNAKSYKEFTNLHLKELVKSRFLKSDWNIPLKDFLLKSSGKDLLHFSSDKIPNNTENYNSWTGFDMLFDMYRLRSADKLAFQDIGEERLRNYKLIVKFYLTKYQQIENPTQIEQEFKQFCLILDKFLNGAPADAFSIDIASGAIKQNLTK